VTKTREKERKKKKRKRDRAKAVKPAAAAAADFTGNRVRAREIRDWEIDANKKRTARVLSWSAGSFQRQKTVTGMKSLVVIGPFCAQTSLFGVAVRHAFASAEDSLLDVRCSIWQRTCTHIYRANLFA